MELSVRPGKLSAITVHLFPCFLCYKNKVSSSLFDHDFLMILGSKWLCHLIWTRITFNGTVCPSSLNIHKLDVVTRQFEPSFWSHIWEQARLLFYLTELSKKLHRQTILYFYYLISLVSYIYYLFFTKYFKNWNASLANTPFRFWCVKVS